MTNVEKQVRCSRLIARLRSAQRENELISATIEHTKRMIQRARLERALLMEKLEQIAENKAKYDSPPPQSPPGGTLMPQMNEWREANLAKHSLTGGNNKLPNAYTVFCDEMRERVTQELTNEAEGTQPKASVVQKTLSERWKLLGKEERKPYTEKAKEIKKKETETKEETE